MNKHTQPIADLMDKAIDKLTEKKKAIFLVIGQHMTLDFEPVGMTPEEVLHYILNNDLTLESKIEFAQSDTGQWSAGWGKIVYKLIDGVFVYYDSKVDSSG